MVKIIPKPYPSIWDWFVGISNQQDSDSWIKHIPQAYQYETRIRYWCRMLFKLEMLSQFSSRKSQISGNVTIELDEVNGRDLQEYNACSQ